MIENGDDVSYEGENYFAVDLTALSSDYEITESGNYVFTGTTVYRIVLSAKGIDVHLFLENASFDSIFSDGKPSSTIITLIGSNTATGLIADSDDDAKGTIYLKNDAVINGGSNIKVTSSDDGINAADGTQTQVNVSNPNCYLLINGGTIEINAAGDGIDNNGVMTIKAAIFMSKVLLPVRTPLSTATAEY